MSFPTYPKYKDSGVEWLGQVPEHWEVIRFKKILHERSERSEDGAEPLLSVSAYTGVSRREDIVDEGEHISRAESLVGYKVCYQHDLVVNIMLAWNRGLAVSNLDGIVSPSYCVFKITPNADPGFLNYLVRSDEYNLYFKAYSTGVIDSRLRLYPDVFGQLYCSIPSIREQKDIASFIDRETSKIDVLVAEQQRLIELLKEKRQAVISHAVTKGLNPDAPMKNSGIDWLGVVPEHWVLQRIKNKIWTIEQGWSPQCESDPVQSEEEWGILKVGCVNYGTFNPVENKALPVALEPQPELGIRNGDLLVSRANTIELVGSAAVADKDYPNLMLCDKLYRLRVRQQQLLPEFLCYYLSCELARKVIELGASGASPSMKNIAQSVILEMPIASPCIVEQKQIIDAIGKRSEAIVDLVCEAQRTIDLLQERRTALISAAVTGKIDVRQLATKEAS